MKPRHLSLFSGGGIGDYAAEQAGFETVAVCECEPDCLYALRRLYPNAKVFEDVKSVGSVSNLGRIDLISGGFPCQDISAAGKGAGLAGARSGLWFEMLRVIREIRPTWVLAENVPALRTRGADRVISDLEEAGYTVWPLVVGAWTAGAPHKRDRVWIVAHAEGARDSGEERDICDAQRGSGSALLRDSDGAGAAAMADTGCEHGQQGRGKGSEQDAAIGASQAKQVERCGELADSPLRQDHGRDAGGLEQEAAGGQGCNAAAGIGGEDELAAARNQGLEGCRNGTIGPSKAQPLSSGIRFDRWPARPGEPQHEWEEPRVLAQSAKPRLEECEHFGREAGAYAELARSGQRGVANSKYDGAGRGEQQPQGCGSKREEYANPLSKTQPALGIPTDGLARPLLPAVRRSLLRVLGNGWAPQVPWLILCWIQAQIEKETND